LIVGRCIDVRKSDNQTFTAVALPAPDEYTQPQTVEIHSVGLIARKGEDVSQKCELAGYRKKFPRKDGTTGYQTVVIIRAIEG
jgi:hypothetical protein